MTLTMYLMLFLSLIPCCIEAAKFSGSYEQKPGFGLLPAYVNANSYNSMTARGYSQCALLCARDNNCTVFYFKSTMCYFFNASADPNNNLVPGGVDEYVYMKEGKNGSIRCWKWEVFVQTICVRISVSQQIVTSTPSSTTTTTLYTPTITTRKI